MNTLELRHLRTLATVRDTGSLSAAAARLHLTQSALSHQVKDLEARLGQTLFWRKSRPLRFTPAGQRLLDLADEVLPRLRATEQDLMRMSGERPGRLHLSIECHSCFQWLLPTLDQYHRQWPEVEIDIPEGHQFDALPALGSEQLDLVVTADPRPLTGVHYEPLFRYQSLLAVGGNHRWAGRDWIAPSELAEETLITYPVEHARQDIFTQFLDPAGVRPHRVRTAAMAVLMMPLVASGRGVCGMPNWALAEYLEQDYVCALSLGEGGVWRTLYAATREEDDHLPWMADFLRTARETAFRVLSGIRPASV